MRTSPLNWRTKSAIFIAMVVLGALFKINLLSPGWNIFVALIVTAVLYVVTGLVEVQ